MLGAIIGNAHLSLAIQIGIYSIDYICTSNLLLI